MMKFLVVGIAATALAVPALAQITMPERSAPVSARGDVEKRVRERLAPLDANKDGTISPDEARSFAQTRMNARDDEMFAAMDADKNGSISRAEFDAHHAQAQMMSGPRVTMMERRIERPRADGQAMTERRQMRLMMMGGGAGRMALAGNGDGIVINDAVNRALERFDAADTNKDGVLAPEERKAARKNKKMRETRRERRG